MVKICSQEIKRCFLLGRKTITNLDSILKSRAITLLTKIHIVKAMVDLDHKESWTPKNWYFLIVVLEETLESPLDCKIKPVNPKGNPSWIFTGRTAAEVKLQYFGHLMQRAYSLEKMLMLGKIGGKKRREWQRMREVDGITNWMDIGLSKL